MLLEVIAMLGCVTVVLRLRALAGDCWNFSCVFKDILSETAGGDLTYHQWSVGDTALLGHCGAWGNYKAFLWTELILLRRPGAKKPASRGTSEPVHPRQKCEHPQLRSADGLVGVWRCSSICLQFSWCDYSLLPSDCRFLCVVNFLNPIQILYYDTVYIMHHYSTDVLFLFPAYYSITKSLEKNLYNLTHMRKCRNLLLFMQSLKLLSQSPLHHFLLVIWKLPRNRFPDFLFIYTLSKPAFL